MRFWDIKTRFRHHLKYIEVVSTLLEILGSTFSEACIEGVAEGFNPS